MKNKFEINLSQMKKYFDPLIFIKGLDYFRKSKVSDIRQKGLMIYSFVDGSGNNKYSVSIKTDYDGSIINTECTCPYKTGCKHAAATLLYYERFGPHKIISMEIDNPLKSESNYKKMEKIIELKNGYERSYGDGIYSFLEKFSPERNKKIVKKNEQYLLVFIIKEDTNHNFYNYGDISRKILLLSLGCQYIKKNGVPGRTVPFSPKKNNVHVNKEHESLYDALLNKVEYTDRLQNYIEHIIKNNIPVIFADFNFYWPVKFYEINKIQVNFLINNFELQNKFVSYRPRVFIHFKKDDDEYLVNIRTFSSHNNILLFADAGNGNIFFRKERESNNEKVNINKFLTEFFTNTNSLTISEIIKLTTFINKNDLSNEIEITGYKEKLKIIKEFPKIILELNESKRGLETITEINIFYKYLDGIEARLDSTGRYLIYEDVYNKFDETIIIEKDSNLDADILNYIKYLLENILIVPDYYYHNQHANIIIKSTLTDFLKNYALELIEKGYEIRLRGESAKFSGRSGKISVVVNSGIDWFDIDVNYEDEEGKYKFNIDRENLLRGLIKVKNNFVLLSKENIELLKKLVDEGMNEEGRLRIPKLHLYLIEEFYSKIQNKENEEVDKFKRILEKLKKFETIEDIEIPKGFNGILRNYQKAGYNWLHFLDNYNINGCLADDMGLGKTVQTLCLLLKLKNEKRLGNVLLVVPVTTLANWENEIKKFTPELTSIRHLGQSRVKEEELIRTNDITIISYHTLRNDIEFFDKLEFNYLILDESQNIKNHNSQIYKAVKLINTNHRLSLSGTPIENNTTELWSQFNFLNPGLLGTVANFNRKYAVPIEKFNDSKASERLKKIIMPFLLRRKKEDVLKELPDKEEIISYCEMDEKQKELYDTLKDFYKKEMTSEIDEKGVEKSAIKFFEGLLRLRQTVLFPEIISEQYKDIMSCKFENFTELLDDIMKEDHKVLIFSQFVEVLKRLKKYSEENNFNYSYIDGSTKKREAQIEKFQNKNDCKIFLLSLKAGGVGINLTKADYVILFDPWWNPAAETQAIDRCHRIGQKNKVIIYKLIVKDSIEEKILILQEKKKALVKDIITEDSSFYKSLTREDILHFFE